MIRVHVHAESPVTLAGLEAILRSEPGFELVDAASDADVLIRDSVPGQLDGMAGIPVVALAQEAASVEALRLGVRAVLPEDALPQQIIAGIYAAAAGLIVVPVEDGAPLLPHGPVEELSEPLTAREMDVIEMLAEGLSNKAIAHRLSISDHTAKFHVNSILAKLRAGTRTEAVMRGIRLGLVKI